MSYDLAIEKPKNVSQEDWDEYQSSRESRRGKNYSHNFEHGEIYGIYEDGTVERVSSDSDSGLITQDQYGKHRRYVSHHDWW